MIPRLAAAAALGGVAACVLLPDRLRLDHRVPFADTVAWRPQAAVAALAGSAVLATGYRTRPAATALGAVGLLGVGAVAGRAVASSAAAAPAPGDLTVLAANALKGRADTGELATLIEREAPDFVVLPEAGHDFRGKLMALVDVLGYRACVSTGPGVRDVDSVTLLAADRAGDVRLRAATAMRIPHVEATGGVLGDRTLYAAHTIAPVGRPRTAAWRHDLAVLAGWTGAAAAPIVAGDLNATLDHRPLRAALGGCRSAASGTGLGLVGTYPARLPRWAGIQIDHVLVPADAVTTRCRIVDIAGSDHRGVLASVRLPTPVPA